MPFTVITLKNVPPSLRGDLTKWMQEIATGVYVGNFNSRIRDFLWERVCDSVGKGEATMSYAYRNEIGYNFETMHADRKTVDFDGIPLVMIPAEENVTEESAKLGKGFSNASKMHHAKRVLKPQTSIATNESEIYAVIDIETTGLDELKNEIIELGAMRVVNGKEEYFDKIININKALPEFIIKLTGINDDNIKSGVSLKDALVEFISFTDGLHLVGYNINFDVKFINAALKKCDLPELANKCYDLMKQVKKEQLFQKDYKLETSLKSYGINEDVPHRALGDAKLIYRLSKKVNKFW